VCVCVYVYIYIYICIYVNVYPAPSRHLWLTLWICILSLLSFLQIFLSQKARSPKHPDFLLRCFGFPVIRINMAVVGQMLARANVIVSDKRLDICLFQVKSHLLGVFRRFRVGNFFARTRTHRTVNSVARDVEKESSVTRGQQSRMMQVLRARSKNIPLETGDLHFIPPWDWYRTRNL